MTTRGIVAGGQGVTSAALAASSGSSLVGFIQSGTGAVARTVQEKNRDILSFSDFNTLANMWAADIYKPKINPVNGKAWFTNDTSPLDYSTSRAGFVWQQRDTASGATNELIPAAVMQFTMTGNGTVNSGAESSSTIWMGLQLSATKTGDASGHCATAIGELGAVGAGGYNELGLFQGTGSNVGSVLGNISGVEMLIQDSPDSGATSYSTRMAAIVGRIAKYNATSRASHAFYASSEGSQPPDAVIGINPSGNDFKRGFDFKDGNFTTGQFGLAPNNTALGWYTAASSAVSIMGLSATNVTYIYPGSAVASTDLFDFAGNTQLSVSGSTNGGTWMKRRFRAPITGTSYTVEVADTHILFFTSATCTITLPSAATYIGKELYLRTIAAFAVDSASSNVSPVAGGAAGTAILAATAGKWAILVSDGTSWQIQAAN